MATGAILPPALPNLLSCGRQTGEYLMFKYVLKRIGYMFLVLFILSIVIFMIYNLTPSDRA